jgi:hypothetical protein
MEQFYYELGQGLPAADALRRVKLRLRAEQGWSNPALWSGYVLIGEATAPLVPGAAPARPFALALGGVLLLTLAWLALRQARR